MPYSYTKNDEYVDGVEFRRSIKDIYDTGCEKFIEWQDNFRKCVDFVYNLNGNEELKEENKLSKKNQELELHNVYTSNKLTSICFAILDQIVRHDNLANKDMFELW